MRRRHLSSPWLHRSRGTGAPNRAHAISRWLALPAKASPRGARRSIAAAARRAVVAASRPSGPLVVVGELFDRAGRPITGLTSGMAHAIIGSDGRWVVDDLWGRHLLFWRDRLRSRFCVAHDPSVGLRLHYAHRGQDLQVFSDPGIAMDARALGREVEKSASKPVMRG